MRFDERMIRPSIDSRLSSLDADLARRTRIRKKIYKAEEPIMRKKLTTSAVFAVVLVLVLVGTAFAVGINLFDYFGNNHVRFKEIAPQTELAHEDVTEIRTDELGLTKVSFNSAYYDGQSLLISYAIENGAHTVSFEPSAEQLSTMQKIEKGGMYWRGSNGQMSWIPEGFEQAVEEGISYGTAKYSIYAHDTFEANDVPLSTNMGLETDAPDGAYRLIEFENPLPEEVQNLESIEIRMGIAMNAAYIWYDGDQFYLSSEQRDVGELRTIAYRAEAQMEEYTGEGNYNDIPVHLRAEVSAVHATLTISADGEAFPKFANDDTWYEILLVTDQGEQLNIKGFDCETDEFNIRYEGIGKLPSELTAYILVCSENNEWTYAELMEGVEPMILKPQH